MSISALILAAGESRRFEGIKQLADINGKTLLNRVVDAYAQAGCSTIYVALGANAEEIVRTLPSYAEVVNVTDWQQGMGHSLSTALSSMKKSELFTDTDKLMVGVADQVSIKTENLKQLIDMALSYPSKIVTASYNQIQGVPAIFGSNDFDGLCELDGDIGARAYIKRNMKRVIAVEMPSAAFDIDTKDDLYNWQISQQN
jgi:molybdenum cofactor cytidylyltransferase